MVFRKCLQAWLRGWVPFEKVSHEFGEIHDVLSARHREIEEAKLKPFYKRIEPFFGRGFIAPFILVSATFFIGHFSGKTPLQTYAVQVSLCFCVHFSKTCI